MNNLNDRIENLKNRADCASQDIREAESALKELPDSKYTEFGTIKWDPLKRRIMMGEKPLIEVKLKERLDGHYYLSCLVDRVIMNTEELFDNLQRVEK